MKTMKDKPTLFLGGAPKSGTTYLFNLLKATNRFNCATPKETFYFVDQTYPLLSTKNNYYKHGLTGFEQFFPSTSPLLPRLEATTHLLYQREILHLFQEQQDWKFIFLLRQPAKRIRSAFYFTANEVALLKENVPFNLYAKALTQSDFKTVDSWVRPAVKHHFLNQELSFSQYADHLSFWSEQLGTDRIRIYLFEDLIEQPVTVINAIFDFMELPISQPLEINTSEQYTTTRIKHKSLHYLTTQWSKYFPSGKLKDTAKQLYHTLQRGKLERDDDEEGLQLLNAHFVRPNQALEQLTGLDLERWR